MYSHYSLQFVDKHTGHAVFEIYIEDIDKFDIPDIIINDIENLKRDEIKDLDHISILNTNIFKTLNAQWPDLIVRSVHFTSHLPYRVHGGREFYLMSEHAKPLTVYSYVDNSSALTGFIEKYFRPRVKIGEFVEGFIIESESPENNIYTKLMFALPDEKWRIEAYKIMYEASKKSGWNDGLEFIEGSLLGYSFEENNLWLYFRKSNGLKWGLFSFFMIVSDEQIDQIKLNGMKSFGLFREEEIFIYSPDRNIPEALSINVIKGNRNGFIVRFYANLLNINVFYKRDIIINEARIGVFCFSKNETAVLNEIIDGKIELL